MKALKVKSGATAVDFVGSNVVIEVDREPLLPPMTSFVTWKSPCTCIVPARVTAKSLKRRYGKGRSRNEVDNVKDTTVDVVSVQPKDRERILAAIKLNIEELTELLVSEVGVFELSMAPALQRARQTLSLVIGQELDDMDTTLSVSQKAMTDIINLKIIDFVCKKMNAATEIKKLVLNRYYKEPESAFEKLLRAKQK